jgi:Flp pilus assembly protein TadD
MGIFSSLFGCRKDASSESQTALVIKITNAEQQNAVYVRGSHLITPHIQLLDRDTKLTEAARAEVSRGIRDLDAVTEYNPRSWASFWIKGKGYQVLGNRESANAAFKASFEIQKENPDVAREYALSCLNLGQGAEAIRVTQHAIQLTPDDAGLHANLALAFLIEGRNSEAKQRIDKALSIAPDDKISRAVQRVVDEVLSGKRKQLKSMSELKNG